ncbi:MAG TPA: undecaprenyl-phosphate glucose phosphotransferase [Gammaproteobacteria bacterium]|nr:undecaprenyl-phosphate glucose phosphotransferase [Gammaproteobacteria bacterium]
MLPRGILREYASVLSFVARFLDAFCIALGATVAYAWRFDHWPMPVQYRMAIILGVLLALILFSSSGIYQSWRGKSWLHQAKVVSLSWFGVVIALILIAFLTKTSTEFSRQWLVAWILSGWAFLLLFRFTLTYVLHAMRRRGMNHKRIVVVGAGLLGQSVAKNIQGADWTGLEVVAFLDDSESLQGHWVIGVQVAGKTSKANVLIEKEKVDEIWLALPLRAENKVKEILYDLRYSMVTVRFVPDIFGFRLLNHSVTDVAGMAVLDLTASPMVGLNRAIKAIEDRVLALFILVLISPLLAVIAAGVKLSSPGPVLFKQKRHGWDGKLIKVYKFRSMMVHCEDDGKVTQAKKCDCRITKFGAFLRRTSLDELPQFFNVLQGCMSIVGPRPHAIAHNEQYKEQIEAYMLRHKVKPGITGWAQVNGLRGETDTLDKMKRRVEYDLYYIEHWSLWFDMKIIVRTLFTGFVDKNAY